jgi:hypothetical protein
MVRRKFHNLAQFSDNLHKGEISVMDFNGRPLPCIQIDDRRYIDILTAVSGKKLAVDILLDIFQDGKNVFVDIVMTYCDYNIEENYLVFANDKKEFFQALASTGMICILPTRAISGQDIFLIQLPKLEAAINAWEQISSITEKI